MNLPFNHRVVTSVIAATVAVLLGGAGAAVAAPMPAVPLTPEQAAVGAAPAVPGIVLNEVSAASWNGQKDEDGEAKDWVEIFNPTTSTVDLSNWGLSNKVDSPFRWVLPSGTSIAAGTYLTVWLSKKDRAVAGKELHASFNLDNGSDALRLTMPNGTAAGQLIDQATPAFVKQNMTWCRVPNGDPAAAFQICATATFGKANTGTSAAAYAATPTITPLGGLYTSSQTVTISVPAGTVVRYTLDGSMPTVLSSKYTAPLKVTKSQSVRAMAFQSGVLPSLLATESYVIDAKASVTYANQRVVMVTLTPVELLAYKAKTKLILMASTVDIREVDGSVIWRGEAESSVSGQLGSRQSQAQAALDISLRDARGAKSFAYDLFSSKGTGQEYDRLRLRNSGSDWWYGRLRDNYAQALLANTPTIHSGYSPTVLFVNGQYSGLMDLREREDETLVESSTNTSKDLVQFVSDGVAKNGGVAAETAWKEVVDYFKKTDMSSPANYAAAQTKVDVENVAYNTAFYAWTNVWDWPWRNVNAYRTSATDNLWRYQPHDFDITMNIPGSHAYWANTAANHNMSSSILASGNDIFKSLMKSPDFQKLYFNTVADQLNYTVEPTRATGILNTMVTNVSPYIPAFRAANPSLGTAAQWESVDVARLRTYVAERPAQLDAQTRAAYKLSARQPLTVAVNDTAAGSVEVNSINLGLMLTPAAPTWTGSYYPEAPVVLTAAPKPGFRFVGWQGASTSTDAFISVPVKSATTITAVFEAAGKAAKPTFAAVAAQSSLTGDLVNLAVPATDPGSFALTYSAKKLPKGLDIDPASGRISGRTTTPGTYAVKVTASNGVSSAEVAFSWTVADRPGTGVNSLPLTGLVQTEYFKNKTVTGTPLAVEQTALVLDVGTAIPVAGLAKDAFSIRWSTTVTPTETGSHLLQFSTGPSDGLRVTLNGVVVLDKWASNSKAQIFEVPVALTAGTRASLVIEFVDYSGAAKMVTAWKTPGAPTFGPIPASVLTAGPVDPALADPAQADPVDPAPVDPAPLAPADPVPANPADPDPSVPVDPAPVQSTEPESEAVNTSWFSNKAVAPHQDQASMAVMVSASTIPPVHDLWPAL